MVTAKYQVEPKSVKDRAKDNLSSNSHLYSAKHEGCVVFWVVEACAGWQMAPFAHRQREGSTSNMPSMSEAAHMNASCGNG